MTNIILLNGGLGNQLFQLFYALNISAKEQIILDWCSRSRTGEKPKHPAVLQLNLPGNVQVKMSKNDSFTLRFFSRFFLHLGVNTKHENILARASKNLIALLGVCYFSIRYHSLIGIRIGARVYRFSTKIPQCVLHIGYFQTRQHISSIPKESRMKLFQQHLASAQLKKIELQASIDKPLIIHVRMGDYINEPDIGQLSPEYFLRAIKRIEETIHFENVWVFSDDESNCLSLIPTEYIAYAKIIPTQELTSIEALLALRFGHGYIISNSTFSWIGAYMRKNELSSVLAPSPWFAKIESDPELTPSDWILVPSEFQTDKTKDKRE